MSLGSQLQKLGLADAKAVKKAEHAKRQGKTRQESEERQERLQRERQEALERQKSAQEEQLRIRQEQEFRRGLLHQVESASVPRRSGDEPYYVAVQGRIRKLWFEQHQYDEVCRGLLRWVLVENQLYLLRREDALRIAEKDPAILIPYKEEAI